MKRYLILLPALLLSLPILAQKKQGLFSKISSVNRDYKITGDTLSLNEKPGPGIVWFDGATFSEGAIEFDVKGKDVLQQSFVGVAFHAAQDTVYDAIYFRPFNFRSKDEDRRSHAVQYISVPAHDWPLLREKYPLKYEQPVSPAPDPNGWFHVKVTVKGNTIKVYVDNNTTPSLTVDKLNDRKTGKVGVWAGNNSGGAWSNFVIRKD